MDSSTDQSNADCKDKKILIHKKVSVYVGQTVEIVLPEYSSAGYLWNAETINPEQAKVLTDQTIELPGSAWDAPGHVARKLILEFLSEGVMLLNMRRPWNEERAGICEIEVLAKS